MKRHFTFLTLIVICLCFSLNLKAQENKKPDWRKLHYLSEEEMNTPVNRDLNFTETDPPTGEVRFVGEFEPMQAVMIRYPLGIPVSAVAEMAEDCKVITVVSTSYQSQAQSTYQNAGVNMANCEFVNMNTDSYWIRDYGPWYIFNDLEPAIVDFVYNRPRPNDNLVPEHFADYWNIDLFGMNLEHTGGNMMEDGRGHGVSDNLVVQENNNNETNVRNKMRDYLGIDPYHITIDPQGDYIAHVDCWGKFLAPDKILIARMPESNSQYDEYESVAEYFATTNCCWGYPYTVYRVDEPGGYTVAPYTNSLILNKKVLVPMGDNSTYNQNAIAVYQEAMPGYEIIGVVNNDYSIGWENTDALHCRARGVADFDMLFVDHRNVIHGEQEWQDSIAVTSKFIAYSGQALVTDSLLIYYSIDGGTYQTTKMRATGNANEYVGYIKGYQGNSEIDYYVFGKDQSGHRYTQPSFGILDPHHFTMEEHAQSELLTITPDTLWIEQANTPYILTIKNETANSVTISELYNEGSYVDILYGDDHVQYSLPLTLQANQSISLEIISPLAPLERGYISKKITVVSNLGTQEMTLMINDEAFDDVIIIYPMAGLYFEEENYPSDEILINNFTHYDVTITSIVEEGGTNYFEFTPTDELPYTITSFNSLTVNVTVATSPILKGYFTTNILVYTDDPAQPVIEYPVYINEDLLTIGEINSDNYSVYPNPVDNVLSIEGIDIKQVIIYNAVGQAVMRKEGSNDIDVAGLSSGMYFVKIYNGDNEVVTKKIVKR